MLLLMLLLEKMSRPQECGIAVVVSRYNALRCIKHNVQPPYFMAVGHFHIDHGVNLFCTRLRKCILNFSHELDPSLAGGNKSLSMALLHFPPLTWFMTATMLQIFYKIINIVTIQCRGFTKKNFINTTMLMANI